MTPRRATPRAIATATTSDAEILTRIAAGEIGALGELYDRHQAPVRRFIVRATSDGEDVDDVLHATFLTAATLARKYDGRASSRPWLVGIAAQLLRRRRSTVARFIEVLSSLRRERSSSDDPRTVLDARGDIDKALASLTEAKRITLLMAEVEGFTCAEIAETLGVPIGTVWTRLHAARREMRDALEGSL